MQTQKDRQDDRRVPQRDTHTLSLSSFFFPFHPSHCCPLSLIICSFPLKTPWTYGPLKPAVSLSANTHTHTLRRTHTLSHPWCGPTSLLDFND